MSEFSTHEAVPAAFALKHDDGVELASLLQPQQQHVNNDDEDAVGNTVIVGYGGGGDGDESEEDDKHDAADTANVNNAAVGVNVDIVTASTITTASSMEDKKKRLCRFPGCHRVIKSQGHCQRHGAKAKRCRFSGCDKQAQGTHDGLCKRHWKAIHFPDASLEQKHEPQQPPAPTGESVYDVILPLSIAFRPSSVSATNTNAGRNEPASPSNRYSDEVGTPKEADDVGGNLHHTVDDSLLLDTIDEAFHMDAAATSVATALYAAESGLVMTHGTPTSHTGGSTTTATTAAASSHNKLDPWDVPPPPDGVAVMPLVQFLRDHANKKAGWHRHQERRARGVFPVSSVSCQLEAWERQLALVEILLLSGGTPYANFKHLSHAWGRERGFHTVLANSVCERRGEVERKRRSDAGKVMTPEERLAFREKLKRSRVVVAPIIQSTSPPTNEPLEQGQDSLSQPTRTTDAAVTAARNTVDLGAVPQVTHNGVPNAMDHTSLQDENDHHAEVVEENIPTGDEAMDVSKNALLNYHFQDYRERIK